MPKKIRELKAMLRKAGFTENSGKGSHTKWLHPLYPGRVTLSGKDGNDAKPYQEKEVTEAIKVVKQREG
ncbi:type II toxin-antitoxin system HicA family toxin [Oscillatoria sp. CS-180]|uniref:type II toxin-antitoxin system HicA family toxin n=1 Tax=Oscillatoria sp. CS-180 TaxID=3021720 RepID=UPI00232EC1A1|nr:type II toxin-antitoxin system HicA family toxin [Oscillatoria sp. CS-180]MDB9527913.1 type II toxin-antitoxin system HicA family toxin [Oscillatoria sp. CS-180]